MCYQYFHDFFIIDSKKNYIYLMCTLFANLYMLLTWGSHTVYHGDLHISYLYDQMWLVGVQTGVPAIKILVFHSYVSSISTLVRLRKLGFSLVRVPTSRALTPRGPPPKGSSPQGVLTPMGSLPWMWDSRLQKSTYEKSRNNYSCMSCNISLE